MKSILLTAFCILNLTFLNTVQSQENKKVTSFLLHVTTGQENPTKAAL
jgi:hypothetical protein